MNGVLIAGVCVAAAMASVMLRRDKPEMALMIGIAAGILATGQAVSEAWDAITGIRNLAMTEGAFSGLSPLFRAGGICLIAELGMDLCEDAGEKALSGRIGLGARCAILAMALPLLLEMLEWVRELLG